jgi:hypothetical protein
VTMDLENNDIQTVQWMETTQMHDEQSGTPWRSSYWLRVNPPALAWRNYIGDSWNHNVQDARGIFHMAPSWDTILLDNKHPLSIESRLRKVRAPVGTDSSPWTTESMIQGEWELQRHSCETVSHNFRLVRTILSEPDTGHIVRSETRQFDPHTGLEVMTTVCSEFVYNAPIPGDIFEILADRPVKTLDLDAHFPDLWPALGVRTKRAIQQTIKNSDTAWLHGDFHKFEREWSFEFQPNVPTRQDWADLMKKHTGLWRDWNSSVKEMIKSQGVTVLSAAFVFTSLSPTDPKMADRSTLWICANYQVEWADNGEVWEGEADFYLMLIGWKYRILHWEFPLEEMKRAHALKKSR